jgi:RNA polymerase sigma factor (sigma-70 family)
MNVHVTYKVSRTPDIEKDIQQQIEKLRRRLQVFRPELVHLKGIIQQDPGHTGVIVSLNLRLPSGQMVVEEAAATATAAVKGAFEDLRQQLGKHKDLLRNRRRWPRWHRGSDNAPEQVPFEQTVAAVLPATVSSADISSYVNANFMRLHRFVERELHYREAAGLIPAEQIRPEEVLDEAVANALGNGFEKPEKLALEPWLYRLARRALDDLAVRERERDDSVPLEQSARSQNVRASDEPHLQFHQPDELLAEEDVIADRRLATPEELLSSDEMMALIDAALRGLDRKQREAFILQAVEGFTIGEIAAITDCGQEEIRNSIKVAREHLRQQVPLDSFLKGKRTQPSPVAS